MKSCLSNLAIVALASAAIISVAYYYYSREEPLPKIEPRQLDRSLVDPSMITASDHRVSGFSLIDQTGGALDSSFVQDKIYVADFFFTTCQTICPRMTGKMGVVADHFSDNEQLRFLSFSVIPEEDTPELLSAYANAYGIRDEQWRLLTGEKSAIYELARKSYFTLKPAEAGQGDGGTSDFIHTNNFVLVDKEKKIRGYYDGTSDLDIERLIKDLDRLIEEYED